MQLLWLGGPLGVVKYSGRAMMMEFSLLLHVRTSADFAAVNKSPSSRM